MKKLINYSIFNNNKLKKVLLFALVYNFTFGVYLTNAVEAGKVDSENIATQKADFKSKDGFNGNSDIFLDDDALKRLEYEASKINSCPKLSIPNLYDKQSNRILYKGLDNWLFRDKYDLQISPKISNENIEIFKNITAILEKQGTKLIINVIPPRVKYAQGFIDYENSPVSRNDIIKTNLIFEQNIQKMRALGLHVTTNILENNSTKMPDAFGNNYFVENGPEYSIRGALYNASSIYTQIRYLPEFKLLSEEGKARLFASKENYVPSFSSELNNLCEELIISRSHINFKADFSSNNKSKVQIAYIAPNSLNSPNLSAFLSYLSGHKVDNYNSDKELSVNAIIDYFNSKAVGAYPKFVILEIPANQLSELKDAEKIIPSVSQCYESYVSLNKNISLNGNLLEAYKFNIFDIFKPWNKNLIQLEFNTPGVTNLKGKIIYKSAPEQEFINEGNILSKKLQYFRLALNNSATDIKRIEVFTNDERPINLKVSICKAK